jgi:hypothetical protein
MRPSKQAEAALARREHLVRVLSELVERTFTAEGPDSGQRLLAELLRRLDDTALRELAYQQGLTTEFDREPEPEE